MLIAHNTAPSQGDIITFKLISGDEIVGKLIATTPESVAVSRPVQIAVQMVAPQQAQIGFMPFMASASDDTNITFRNDAMVNKPVKTRDDVAKNYIRATSGIEVATAQQAAGLIRG